MKLIGLAGQKRCGKDTVYSMLAELMPFAVIRLAFADDLKREVAQACGVTISFIESHKENFRLILQGWGTEFRREIHGRKYWVHRMERSIHRVQSASKDPRLTVVITDVRFRNEAEMVKGFGGSVVNVSRPYLQSSDNHASENDLAGYKFDSTISNSGSLDDLKAQVESFSKTF